MIHGRRCLQQNFFKAFVGIVLVFKREGKHKINITPWANGVLIAKHK